MISKLQYITSEYHSKSHLAQAKEVCEAGIDWVQLRMKERDQNEILDTALQVQNICIRYGAKLIINDNVEIAKQILADGVHLGKSDMSPSDARKILGENFIIGGTANTFEDVINLTNEGVDYIGLGPFRFTDTKKNLSAILGISGYKNIFSELHKYGCITPIVAIGGIDIIDIPELMSAGAYGIAISQAICSAENPQKKISEIKHKIYAQ